MLHGYRVNEQKEPGYELFERFLPYAMALGVERRWARAFEGIYSDPPRWFTGPQPGDFSAFDLTRGLDAMADRTGQVMTSKPRPESTGSSSSSSGWSSSSFSGGFSGGGGSSGGGFGGGRNARLLSEAPIAKLDLHGLTAEQARLRLREFLTTHAHAARGGVVHIITGKGLLLQPWVGLFRMS